MDHDDQSIDFAKYIVHEGDGMTITNAIEMMEDTAQAYFSTPSTVEEFLLHHMVQNGMFLPNAQVVFDIFSSQDHVKDIRWKAPINHYPKPMLAVLQLGINNEVIKWVDKNLPHAYFRPMFL